MKKLIITILVLIGGSFAPLDAQESTAAAPAGSMERTGKTFRVRLNLNLDTMNVKSNRMVVLTPFISNENDTLNLSSIGLMGRRRYFFYERNEKRYPEVFENENFRDSEKPADFVWDVCFPYEKWMDGSNLKLLKQVYGCCNDLIEDNILTISQFNDFTPPSAMDNTRG